MNINYEVDIQNGNHPIAIAGDGSVSIDYQTNQGMDYIELPLELMEAIVDEARAHKTAYDAYKAAGYDPDVYHQTRESIK